MSLLALEALVTACAASALLTPLLIRWARRVRVLDLPDSRKVHGEPVPRLGGVAVVGGFVAGLSVVALQQGVLFRAGTVTVYWHAFAMAALGIFVLGLVDDLRGLSFRTKFVFETLAALFVWLAGFRIERLTVPFDGGTVELGWASLPVTMLWIVGVCNAMNLLDGLDGLAAGAALIITSAVAVVAVHMGHLGVSAASVALVGSLAGFLPFNFRPARVFLGDSGSLFLGFVLAVISVRGSQKGATAVAVALPVLVLALPLADTAFAVIRRSLQVTQRARRDGVSLSSIAKHLPIVFSPDRGHIHHRLLDAGLSHARAVLMLYAVVAGFALAGIVVTLVHSSTLALLALSVAVVPTACVGFVLRRSPGKSLSQHGASARAVRRS